MQIFQPRCLTTGIGSVPLNNAKEAVDYIKKYLPEVPHWPQLPARSFEEGFTGQFMAPFIKFGLAVREGDKVWFDYSAPGFETRLAEFYGVILEALEGNDEALQYFAFPREFASGFYTFLEAMTADPGSAKYIKGQLSGPLTVGLELTDHEKKAIYYHPQLRDMLVKSLTAQGIWQARTLAKTGLPVIMFVDDPSLTGYGLSTYITLNKEEIRSELNEIYAGIHSEKALTGTHVCASADWTILMDSDVDIINFDAYEYFSSMAVYPEELKAFLQRGGVVAWGVVPTSTKIMDEDSGSLVKRFDSYIEQLEGKGISRELLLNQAMITPSCGTGTLSREESQRVYQITFELGKHYAKK